MELRFATAVTECADPVAALEGADFTCRWTGFRSQAGMRAYVEDDGTDTVACSVAFAARHAGMLDASRHVLVWVPELTQREVADVARLHALAKRTYRKPGEDDARKVMPEGYDEVFLLRDRISDAYDALRARAAAAEGLRGDSGLSIAALLRHLPPEARARILDGLRVLPLGFGSREIASWTEAGASMEGVAVTRAFAARWFSGEADAAPRDWDAVAPRKVRTAETPVPGQPSAPAKAAVPSVGEEVASSDDHDTGKVATEFLGALLRDGEEEPIRCGSEASGSMGRMLGTALLFSVEGGECGERARGTVPEARRELSGIAAAGLAADGWLEVTPRLLELLGIVEDANGACLAGTPTRRMWAVSLLNTILDASEGMALTVDLLSARTEVDDAIEQAGDSDWLAGSPSLDAAIEKVMAAGGIDLSRNSVEVEHEIDAERASGLEFPPRVDVAVAEVMKLLIASRGWHAPEVGHACAKLREAVADLPDDGFVRADGAFLTAMATVSASVMAKPRDAANGEDAR